MNGKYNKRTKLIKEVNKIINKYTPNEYVMCSSYDDLITNVKALKRFNLLCFYLKNVYIK